MMERMSGYFPAKGRMCRFQERFYGATGKSPAGAGPETGNGRTLQRCSMAAVLSAIFRCIRARRSACRKAVSAAW